MLRRSSAPPYLSHASALTCWSFRAWTIKWGHQDIAGDMLVERLARSAHHGRRIHLKYPEAGHVIGIPFMPTAMQL